MLEDISDDRRTQEILLYIKSCSRKGKPPHMGGKSQKVQLERNHLFISKSTNTEKSIALMMAKTRRTDTRYERISVLEQKEILLLCPGGLQGKVNNPKEPVPENPEISPLKACGEPWNTTWIPDIHQHNKMKLFLQHLRKTLLFKQSSSDSTDRVFMAWPLERGKNERWTHQNKKKYI